MAILTERKIWKKPPASKPATDRINRLTPEEAENVRAALRVARARFGTLKGLARQMGVAEKIFGVVSGPNRMRIRNTLYYLRREGKGVRRRPDGVWEVVAA